MAQPIQKAEIEDTYSVNLLPFNTTAAEYCPAFYKNGILFCSNRDNNLGVVYTSESTDLPLADIYFSNPINKTKWKNPVSIGKNINSYLSEGPASLTKGQDKIFFTRNDVVNDRSKLNIYYSSLKDNTWEAAKPLALNNEKYSCGHPAISPTGNYIIFASNMPGGFGGTDLYISYLKSEKWTKPQNLGNLINTKGNEISPYIHDNTLLYFASDGHNGEGGFDIFSVYYSQFEWKGLKNIGYPFNSRFNDFGFIIDDELNNGYFSSNRLNGGDDDDIYSFAKSEIQFKNCDSVKHQNLCRTFFEEGTVPTESLPLVYEWNFGDGTKQKGAEARHCFAKAGIYTIQLNIVDLISDQVFLNEATYEFEIKPVRGAYFEIPDTLMIGTDYTFDGSKTYMPDHVAKDYAWDFGTGQIFMGIKQVQQFYAPGQYDIKLSVNAIDSTKQEKYTCVVKTVSVLTKTMLDEAQKKEKQKPDEIFHIAKTIYSIKDSDGNSYKIQLGVAKNSIKEKFKKLEGIMNIEEYFDRKVYGYTTGSFKNPIEAYPTLKKIRKIGFKEAILIAMKDGKIVSGTDSATFANLDGNFAPIKIVNVSGKVVDRVGNKLPANVIWESIGENLELGNMQCTVPIGEYSFNITDGDLYAYTASITGFYPSANHIDLTKENAVSDIISDIILYKVSDLVDANIPLKMNNLFFASDKYDIEPESENELRRLAEFIQANPAYKFEIGGHTDHTGDETYNTELSQKRANAVMNFLVNLGCQRKALIAKGYGNSKLVTTNKKLIELNRRVEVKVFKN